MNILLVNPYSRNIDESIVIPLGIAYIATVLKQSGYQVKVIDLNIHPYRILYELVPRCNLIGISSNTLTYSYSKKVLALVKKIKPDIITVMGGPHPTCLPTEVLYENNFVDIVVIGEGENTMKELCEKLEKGEDIDSVAGIAYRRNGDIRVTPPREFIKNLDDLPFPDLDLFPPLELYTTYSLPHTLSVKTAGIITSRGCPYSCIFCFKSVFGKKWRARSPENVVNEWEILVKKYKVKQIAVLDDTFNIDQKRVIEICDLIIKRKLVVPWQTSSGLHANHVSEELILKMKEAGCYKIAIGVESGNQRVLDVIDKKTTLSQLRKVFRLLKKHGLETSGFFVLGIPGENELTMKETIKFAKVLDPDYVQFTIANPFPGTRLYSIVKEKGRFLKKYDDFSAFTGADANFKLPDLPAALLKRMRKKAYISFYLRPKYLIKRIFNKNFFVNIRLYPLAIKRLIHYLVR